MTTVNQTAYRTTDGQTYTALVLQRPTIPDELWAQVLTEQRVIGIRRPGSRILLFPDGSIVEYQRDGSITEYDPVPTMESLLTETMGSGTYTRFMDDGSIMRTQHGDHQVFSAPFPSEPLKIAPSDLFYGRVKGGVHQVRKKTLQFHEGL